MQMGVHSCGGAVRIGSTVSGLPLLRLDDALLIRGHRGSWSLDFLAVVDGTASQVTLRVGRRRELDALLSRLRQPPPTRAGHP